MPLNSAIEDQYIAYLISQNIPNVEGRICRTISSGSVEAPAIFVTATQPGAQISSNQAGIYRVPISISVVYTATQVYEDQAALDTLTDNVETALGGAQAAINNVSDAKVHIFDVTMKTPPNPEVEGHIFRYAINLEAVCKKKS